MREDITVAGHLSQRTALLTFNQKKQNKKKKQTNTRNTSVILEAISMQIYGLIKSLVARFK